MKNIKAPDTYVIFFCLILFFAALTYIIPVGRFTTKVIRYQTPAGVVKTSTIIVPNSFRYLRNKSNKPIFKRTPFFNSTGGAAGITNYLFEGLSSGDKWGSAIGVVFFILIIGGALGIIIETRAIESGILSVIKRVEGKEVAIIPLLFILFSLGGALFGMQEEVIAFSAVIIPLVIAVGYDGITAVLISYVAAQIGYATSPLNPFCAMIGQEIAGVPILSGAYLRWIMWICFTALGIIYSIFYARKIKMRPKQSLSYKSDAYFRKDLRDTAKYCVKFKLGHALIIVSIFAALGWITWGVLKADYFIPQLATIFFILGLTAGIIGVIFKLNNMTINGVAASFRNGSKELLGAALVVGMAKGIVLVLGGSSPNVGTVLNTILHISANGLSMLPPQISAGFMYLFQDMMRLLVPSTSGQAALTMPLMAPLSVLIGLNKQIAVLIYQLSNFVGGISPTDAPLIGVLAVARIDWLRWARSQYRLQILLFVFALAFILLAIHIGYR